MNLPSVICEDCRGLVEGTEHWLTCTSPRARQKRIRRFREPGYFPVSYSSMKVYEECERRYQWQYILGGEDESGDPARLGIAAHERLAALVSAQPPPAAPDVPLELSQTWAEMRESIDELAIELYRDRDLIGTEVELFAELPLHTGQIAQAKGILDTLSITEDGFAKVIDYKSGFKMPTEDELKKAGSQGLWNAWLIRRNYGHVFAVEFEIRPLRQHAKPVRATYSVADIDEFEMSLAAQLAVMVEDRDFRPRPAEKRCRQCPLLLNCDAGLGLVPSEVPVLGPVVPLAGRVAFPAIRTPQEAAAFARQLVQAEAVVDAAREMMSNFTEWYGPVGAGEGKAYAHWEERWKELDVPTFFAQMRKAGKTDEEIIACLKVDMKAADRYIWGRKRPALAPVKGLREALIYTLHTRFGLKKLKGELLDD